jgi:hypothetical protein
MALPFESETLLYALGVVFAVGALVYFASDVVFGLSTTVTAVLLFLGFLGFLLAGLAIEREPLDTVAFAISGVSYVVFLGYVGTAYDLGEASVLLLLAASAALFVGLGYGLQEDRLVIDRRTARLGVLACGAVGLLLVGVDAGSAMTYSADLEAETTPEVLEEAPDHERALTRQRIGTLTVRNPSPFTRSVDLPSISGCVVGLETPPPERGVRINYEPRSYELPNQLGRNGELRVGMETTLELPTSVIESGTPIGIERGEDCSVTRSEPTIIVTFEDTDVR